MDAYISFLTACCVSMGDDVALCLPVSRFSIMEAMRSSPVLSFLTKFARALTWFRLMVMRGGQGGGTMGTR